MITKLEALNVIAAKNGLSSWMYASMIKQTIELEEIILAAMDLYAQSNLHKPDVSGWVAYPETRPDKYGKYFVHRKDGKTHWETWNTSGFAYNDKVITHWMEVKPPCR